MPQRAVNPYRIRLADLERSVRVPVDKQIAEQQTTPPEPIELSRYEAEQRQLRLAPGA